MGDQPHTETLEQPDHELINFIEQQIDEFNRARWPDEQKRALAVISRSEDGTIVAGAAAKTFGNWLLVENLWVSDGLRGRGLGSRLLKDLETAALKRGCRHSLLDTLEFQARPFYERHGYRLQWTQDDYPLEGAKHFMTKQLGTPPVARSSSREAQRPRPPLVQRALYQR